MENVSARQSAGVRNEFGTDQAVSRSQPRERQVSAPDL